MLHYLPLIYVEDNHEDFLCFEETLKDAKHQGEILNLRSAAETMGYLKTAETVPGLFMVDLYLPELSGVQLIPRAREKAAWAKVPIVAVSDQFNYDFLDQCYEAGSNLFFVKPTTRAGWADLVFKLFDYFSPSAERRIV